jgi:hypothetical protein
MLLIHAPQHLQKRAHCQPIKYYRLTIEQVLAFTALSSDTRRHPYLLSHSCGTGKTWKKPEINEILSIFCAKMQRGENLPPEEIFSYYFFLPGRYHLYIIDLGLEITSGST